MTDEPAPPRKPATPAAAEQSATSGGAASTSSTTGSSLPAAPRETRNTGLFPAALPQREHVEAHPEGKRLALLSLTALGIVYGDIGTSPLYALQQCFAGVYGLKPTVANVYGLLSM